MVISNSNSASIKKVLVTGATSGIGWEIANACRDMCLVITGRNRERLDQFQSVGTDVISVQADLNIADDRKKIVEAVGQLDGLVMAAGVINYTPAKFLTEEKMDEILATNFKSGILLLSSLLKQKKIAKNASIIFISSISSKIGVPGTLVYAASKAAINAAVKVLAAELARQRIRVNAICPGLVETPMTSQAASVTEGERDTLAARYPLGLGKPSDITGLVRYLLSDESSWMTGGNIDLDGGFTLNC